MNKTTQPIKNKKKVKELLDYLNGKNKRNYIIAKIQLDTAQRLSDILRLKARDIFDCNFKIKPYSFLKITKSLENELIQYIKENDIHPQDYLFSGNKKDQPISQTQIHRVLQDAAKALNISEFGSNSLRKTWGYFYYKKTGNIEFVQAVFNHASSERTFEYIGVKQE